MLLYKVEIPGRVPIKKNTARRYRFGVVYSKAYQAWEKLACGIIRNSTKILDHERINEPCEARFKFYLKNKQWEPDLSNVCEGPQDVLETCEVLANDKLIMRLKAEKMFDSKNPRLEIELHTL